MHPAGIDYLTGTRVTGVDVGAKSLTTAGGQTITWDKLVVATGARVSAGAAGAPSYTGAADSRCPGVQGCVALGVC